MNEWLRSRLVCPRDKKALEISGRRLTCPDGHLYPIVDDIPVMLVDDAETTHDYITKTIEQTARTGDFGPQIQEAAPAPADPQKIDEFVQGEIPYTSGNMYFSVQYKLNRYPIPECRLPAAQGEKLLDIGCNWGRWTIAAARKGYRPVGLDPSLDAVRAARRVARQLGAEADFVVGDARFLPFADDTFPTVFSYGVLQHFSKENVGLTLDEVARVLRPGGRSLIQMPNKYGVRQYQQYRARGRTEGVDFEVRYWTPAELRKTFEGKIGRTEMTTDCFFGLGIQGSDVDLLPVRYQMVVYSSEFLRKLSRYVKPITKVADSVYLESVNQSK
jgi:SAM-dependent methyltransferase/uncharacterized protein YbaR (Trm112 family)